MNLRSRLWKRLQAPWLANSFLFFIPALAAGMILLLDVLAHTGPGTEPALTPWQGHGILFILFALGFLAPVFAQRLVSFRPRNYYILAFGLLSIYALMGQGGTFYSDDAIRHELDGHYIVRGLPLYCMSPLELGPVGGEALVQTDSGSAYLMGTGPGRLPNHPHLATIYFPGTQLMALLGALGPGYRFLFAFSSLMMMAILLFFRPASHGQSGGAASVAGRDDRSGTLLITLFAHPFWMILYFSGHSDVTAILLCLLALKWMGSAYGRILAGMAWALACSMKPEAALVGLSFLVLWPSSRSDLAASIRRGAPFLVGVLLILSLLVPFTLFDLFHLQSWKELRYFSTQEGSSLEIECFFYTARIYSDQFLSYRPDAVWLTMEGPLNSREAIRLVRMLLLPAWSVLGLRFIPGLHRCWKDGAEARFGETEAAVSSSDGSGLKPMPGYPIRQLFLYLLIGYFLYRGSWQPWYFLWFILAPGIWFFRDRKESETGVEPPGANNTGRIWPAFFLSLLTLFYLPLANYRVDGRFDLSFFYTSFLLALLVVPVLYFYGFRRTSGRKTKKD